MKRIVLILFLCASSYGFGQQLVYKPINSAFGGDPFNYTWLLSSANAQNPFSDSGIDGLDLDALNSSLDSQLLQNQFGGELPPLGSSTNGSLAFDVFESTDGLVINILDIFTGEQSQIIIPQQ